MKKPQLFLLHFAGGSCRSFQFLTSSLMEFDVIPLELPGRGRRAGEPLLNEFGAAVRDIYEQLTRRLTSPAFLIYGHSMGAYLGLAVANLLVKAGIPPAYLIVSGNAGPKARDDEKVYLLDRVAFIQKLEKLGGVSREIVEDEELFDYFEPILRADFEIVERNDLTNEQAVSIPLYAMMGSQEEEAGEIENWSNFSRTDFKFEIMEGDHFFIYKHPQRIATIIRDCYQRTAMRQKQSFANQ
jgi:external thioesterase TEII